MLWLPLSMYVRLCNMSQLLIDISYFCTFLFIQSVDLHHTSHAYACLFVFLLSNCLPASSNLEDDLQRLLPLCEITKETRFELNPGTWTELEMLSVGGLARRMSKVSKFKCCVAALLSLISSFSALPVSCNYLCFPRRLTALCTLYSFHYCFLLFLSFWGH